VVLPALLKGCETLSHRFAFVIFFTAYQFLIFFLNSKFFDVIQELDMVVSVKEATQSRLQLLEDRKMLMKQLNDLKKKSRMTMVNTERDDLQQKTTGNPSFPQIVK